ncbi:hypothetical protein PIB30_080842 [Stylosanthes scabra]|uniref:Uncharacterized protein n=1 Tax=Stylosanthes scabra TaxID=79078 RepID=A0ABU6YQK0_9FABA|nr:hypothetical protein [Stylosanthes scabra]
MGEETTQNDEVGSEEDMKQKEVPAPSPQAPKVKEYEPKIPFPHDAQNPFGIRTFHRQVHRIVSSNKKLKSLTKSGYESANNKFNFYNPNSQEFKFAKANQSTVA